jgi:hypothetical protein
MVLHWTCVALAAAAIAAPTAAEEPPEIEWCGTDFLVTASVGSDVRVVIRGSDDGTTTLHGVWPDVGLYGVFDGDLVHEHACAVGRRCAQFRGILHDLEAGGFPPGTEAPMLISLDMATDGSGARGVYKIDLFPGGYPIEQYGILELGACPVV